MALSNSCPDVFIRLRPKPLAQAPGAFRFFFTNGRAHGVRACTGAFPIIAFEEFPSRLFSSRQHPDFSNENEWSTLVFSGSTYKFQMKKARQFEHTKDRIGASQRLRHEASNEKSATNDKSLLLEVQLTPIGNNAFKRIVREQT